MTGCAGATLSEPNSYFQTYEPEPVELGEPVAVPETPSRDSVHGDQVCFEKPALRQWFAIHDLAEDHGDMAAANREAALALEDSRDDLVAAGRDTEAQGQMLYRELRRCEVKNRILGWGSLFWLAVGVFVGSQ